MHITLHSSVILLKVIEDFEHILLEKSETGTNICLHGGMFKNDSDVYILWYDVCYGKDVT